MINHITINNFAIIENTEIDFEDGLNIVTGETGSGKSIVIEAISLALGSRADSSFVRHGANKAIVQLAGELDNEEIVITREVSATGKNLCKLNGQLVTLNELSETCKKIADIHGQYDNQSLLNIDHHIELVDKYHFKVINPIKQDFLKAYGKYQEVKTQLNKLLSKEKDNIRKIEFYKFEKIEIDNAELIIGEDEQLEERISLLQNSEKIFSAIESSYEILYDGDAGAMSGLGNCLHTLKGVSRFSKEIASLSSEFEDIYYKMEDITTALRQIRDNITFTPDELDRAISRLDLIDSLKKKYGKTIPDIIDYGKKIAAELEQIENFDEIKEALEKTVAESFDVLKKKADLLTEARKNSASSLEQAIEKELHDLNFDAARLSIVFNTPENIGSNGNDLVEIMLSTNKGEPMKPLVKVASGGEISRIMLAIKNITGTYDNIATMIFDEIDAGISGVTASIVGKKLKEISKNHQIICITHLPQIAAAGDYNYRIFKESDENNTFTHVEKLSTEQKIDEIARLLGGTNITATTRESAKELINS